MVRPNAPTGQDLNAPSLLKGSLSQFLALGAGVASLAITTPVVLHALGPSVFGLWMTLLAAVSFSGLLDFGISQAVARFVGEYRAKRDADAMQGFLIATAAAYLIVFALVLLASLGIAVVLPAIVRVPSAVRGVLGPATLLAGVATGLGLWGQFFAGIVHAHQQLAKANVVRALTWVALTILTCIAAFAGWGMVGLAAAMALSAAMGCAAHAVLARRALGVLRVGLPQRRYLREALSYSVFMFMTSVGTAIVVQTDTIIIATFIGIAAVTAYAITLQLTRGLTLFLHKVPDVLFPFYAGMRAIRDFDRMRASFLLTARLQLAGGVIVVLGLAFAGRPFIQLWVGPAGITPLAVFVLAVALVLMECLIHPVAVLAAAAGGERPMAVVNNGEAALNLGLALVLVTRFGVAGVIAATVLAEAVTNLWFMPRWAITALRLPLGIYLRATAGRVLAPGLIAAALGTAISLLGGTSIWGVVAAVTAVAVFVMVYLAVGAGDDERRVVRRVSAILGRAA